MHKSVDFSAPHVDPRERCQALWQMLQEVTQSSLSSSSQVVLGTNTSLGELELKNNKLPLINPIVLIDEAAQSTEPSTMIPLTLGAQWVLMCADLKQLRPTIKSRVAMDVLGWYQGGGGSLYGR